MSDIKRHSRSFGEDPDYSPAWRANQALEYRRVYRDLVSRGENNIAVIPEDENDEYVIDYYSYLVYGSCHYPQVKYAHSCFNSNYSKGFGTQMQAMLLGKEPISKIADSFKTKRENVECYLKLFFDVEEYLDCESLIYSIISPFDRWKETPLDAVANSIWMGISYEFGWDTAKYILQRRLHVTDEVAKKLSDAMQQCLSLQAGEYVLGTRLASHARPSDFERHVAYTNAMSLSEQNKIKQDGMANGEFFKAALWSTYKEVSSTLTYDDPIRKMIGDREKVVRGETLEPEKELVYFAPQPL